MTYSHTTHPTHPFMTPIYKLRIRIGIALLAIFSACWLAACSQPVSNENSEYVGYWEGGNQVQDVKLLIKANGHGVFEMKPVAQRGTGAHPVRHSGPLKFYGEQFVIGLTHNAPTFVVTQPPFQDGQDWLVKIGDFSLKKMPMSKASDAFINGDSAHPSDEFDGLASE